MRVVLCTKEQEGHWEDAYENMLWDMGKMSGNKEHIEDYARMGEQENIEVINVARRSGNPGRGGSSPHSGSGPNQVRSPRSRAQGGSSGGSRVRRPPGGPVNQGGMRTAGDRNAYMGTRPKGKGRSMEKPMYIERGSWDRRNRRRRRGTGKIVLLALLFLIAAGAVGGYLYVGSLSYKVCRVEAGVQVSPSDFLKKPDENAVFAQGSDSFDITEPGEYHVKVKSGFFTHKCTLIIEDTIAPRAQAVPVKIPVGTTCGPESFVSGITDATQVTVSFVLEPDFTLKGAQTVQIALTDKGNNRTVLESELYLSIVADSVTVEAGQGAPGLDRFVAAGEVGQFVTQMSDFDYTKVGDYTVSLLVNGDSYTSVMHIVDTVPPVVEVHDLEDFAFVPVSPMDFVSEMEDVTEVTAAYKKEPDLSKTGTQEVELVFTDQGNNKTEKTAKLTLKEDTEAPVIHGAVDLTIYAGDTVSYKKDVTVTDNSTKGLILDVDTSKVNTRAEGVYPVTYVARDAAGNTDTVTVNLTVKARKYDIDEVNTLGDSILSNILTPDMSETDKLHAIYSYIMGHISYINDSEKGDWVQAAYEGLMNRKGDCYVYASTAKLLLTRAGIKNMDIEKIPSDTLHYWNLVDIGDGWYHFDTTPRKDHPTIFMWDDQQMMEYSEAHDKSHNYDHALYPRVNGAQGAGAAEEPAEVQ